MDFLLNNNVIQGTGHLAQAYADLALRGDFKKAYDGFTTALALFKVSDIVPRVMADVQVKVEDLQQA